VEDLLRDLDHKLEAVGKLELLENVTAAAENYFARMEPAMRDAQTETHTALAAMTSGDILRQKGDHGAAQGQYAKAEAQLAQLAAAIPRDARLWRDLGTARNNLALIAELAGDTPGATVWFNQATVALTEAAPLDPANPDCRRELIVMRVRRLDDGSLPPSGYPALDLHAHRNRRPHRA
jgi:tetratricopeptide (TPR) repeat protein